MKAVIIFLVLALFGWAALAASQAPGDLLQPGKEIFLNNCADCHRANGEGLPNSFPALAKNPLVVGDAHQVIAIVLNGRKGKLGRMPAWKNKLNDQQLAAVVSYIRQAWTNQAFPVTPAMVASLRKR